MEGVLAEIGVREMGTEFSIDAADWEAGVTPLVASVVPTVSVTLIVGVNMLSWFESVETLSAAD